MFPLGLVEGKLGSIRYLCVLQKFRGVCLGQRLLDKVESVMLRNYDCCRSMVCLSNRRKTLCEWAERRGYGFAGSQNYPCPDGQKLLFDDVRLLMFVKALSRESEECKEGFTSISKKKTGKINMSPIWRLESNDIPDVD